MPPRARIEQAEERTENGGQAGRAGVEGGGRTATLTLPFFTAQFRAPDHLVPTRDDVAGAARGVRSMLPSGRSTLLYGGLGVTAALGVIEWPVAVAIGVGAALAQLERPTTTSS